MKYRKFNKYERKEVRKAQIAEAMSGSGTYIFQNSSNTSELTLPRPTSSGRRVIEKAGQFQGDSYYLQMVKTGMLRIVEVIQTPEQEQEAKAMNEEKLILDQPDMVTESGKVEHVVEKKTVKQKLNEGGNDPKPDVLLNEYPSSDDGFVILG